MKINFSNLKKIEKQLSSAGNSVSINVMQKMLKVVLEERIIGEGSTLGYLLAVNTLKDMGILEDDTKPVQQLNS